MGSLTAKQKQYGFFDAGISLLILALAGAGIFFIEQDQQEKLAQANSSQSPGAEVLILKEENAGLAAN